VFTPRNITIISIAAILFSLLTTGQQLIDTRAAAAQLVTKTFVWPMDIRAGDCSQVTAKLILRSDGTAHFSSVVWASQTQTGETFWTRFVLRDASKESLIDTPLMRGPRMEEGVPAPRYPFDFDFTFDASKFKDIIYVSIDSRC
jgi:hypothetical protein